MYLRLATPAPPTDGIAVTKEGWEAGKLEYHREAVRGRNMYCKRCWIGTRRFCGGEKRSCEAENELQRCCKC